MRILFRSRAAQEFVYQSFGMRGEFFIAHPYRRQHRQISEGTEQHIAPDISTYALSFQHASDQMRFGGMARGMYKFHISYAGLKIA